MKKLKAKEAIFTENVGIGEGNPSDGLLHLNQSSNDAIRLQRSNAGVNDGNIYFGHSGGGLGVSTSGAIGVTNPDFFISSSGNVGIGTTSPNTSLEITGAWGSQFRISRDADQGQYSEISGGGSTMKFKSVSNTHSSFTFVSDDENGEVERMRVNAAGNVGIGTVVPTSRLHIANVAADTRAFRISRVEDESISLLDIFQDSSWEDGSGIGQGSGIAHVNTNNRNLAITTSSDQSLDGGMFINVGGNVGIGTTNPGVKLVIEDSSSDVVTQYRANNNYAGQIIGKTSGIFSLNGRLGLDFNFTGNQTSAMRIDSSGNVGIGTTSPICDLDINGTLMFSTTPTSSEWMFETGGTTLNIKEKLSTGSFTSRLCFLDGGNVGIGTTNPESKLQIWSEDDISMRIHRPNSGLNPTDTVGIGFSQRSDTAAPVGDTRAGIFSTYNGDLFLTARAGGDINSNPMDYSRLFIEGSNGNIGIGTTNPGAYKLTVEGSQTEFIQKIANTHTTSAYGLYVTFDANLDNTSSEYIRCSSNGNTNINFKVYSNGTIYADGASLGSDDRIKHNEEKIVNAVEVLSKITPKKYFKTTKLYDTDHNFDLDSDGNPVDENGEPVDHRVEAGVIAQEVLGVDELKFTVSPEEKNEDGDVVTPYSLNYNSLFTYAIAAIQEQQSIIDDLKSQNELLKTRIENIESKI